MNLRQGRIKASDLELVQPVESFHNPREPSLGLGNFVKLNSGGPTMMMVDHEGLTAIFAWVDRSGAVCERQFPVACVHRVSPASAETAAPAA
jgi:hypothetical protein